MDYNHIQQSIIAGAVSEGRFNMVSYLEPVDFDTQYREIWKVVLSSKGDIKQIYKLSKPDYYPIYLLCDYTHIEILALILLERRFKSLLIRLLEDIALKSENASEGLILANTINEIETLDDVFDLIDKTPEYLKPFLSKEAYSRLSNLQLYVDKRCEKIKEVLG